MYLTVFGKPRYLGVAEISDDEINFDGSHSVWAVIKSSRGVEMGIIGGKISQEQRENYRISSLKFEDTTEAMLQEVKLEHIASSKEIENIYKLRCDENDALIRARELLGNHDLKIKLVDVEFMLDRKKLFFYFTAGQRIDFRSYVRDLAHEFRTRIEMRQIGTRDEARIVRGIASCGRECCCGYWLRGFSPIGMKMVKEQRMSINPSKISGLCGRLMCCMSYEQALYSELWDKLPGPGAKIKTEQGVYILESLDVGREIVNIRFPTGRLIPVKIDEFPNFKDTVLNGEEWEVEEPANKNLPAIRSRTSNALVKADSNKNEPVKKFSRVKTSDDKDKAVKNNKRSKSKKHSQHKKFHSKKNREADF